MTQSDVASALGVSQGHYTRSELGSRFSVRLVKRFADKFGVDYDWLLTGDAAASTPPIGQLQRSPSARPRETPRPAERADGAVAPAAAQDGAVAQQGAADPELDRADEASGPTGDQVRRIRESLGWTRVRMARELGLHPETIRRIELNYQRMGRPAFQALRKAQVAMTEGDVMAKLRQKRAQELGAAIDETYRLMTDEESRASVQLLARQAGETEADVIRRLVAGKFTSEL